VYVDVGAFESVGVDAELAGAAFDEAESGLGAFFHDVANLAGEKNVAFAGVAQGFDVEDFSAGGRPGQARDDARFAGLEFAVADVSGRAEEYLDDFRGLLTAQFSRPHFS